MKKPSWLRERFYREIPILVRRIRRYGFIIVLSFMFILFWAGFFGLRLFEPWGKEITGFHGYWWYFVVTAATVGYGDMAPTTTGGRLIGIIIMFGGIGSMGMIISQVTLVLTNWAEKRRKGAMGCNFSRHTVIFGYHTDRTRYIMDQLRLDPHYSNRNIVLCFLSTAGPQRPLPDYVEPVAGMLSSQDVMQRSGVERASRVLIDARGDHENLSIFLGVRETKTPAHIVITVHDKTNATRDLNRIDQTVECLSASNMNMIVQALRNPGISRFYKDLTTSYGGQECFRLNIPEAYGPWRFEDLLIFFKIRYDALIVATCTSTDFHCDIRANPGLDAAVIGGQGLIYIARERLKNVDFGELQANLASYEIKSPRNKTV